VNASLASAVRHRLCCGFTAQIYLLIYLKLYTKYINKQ